MTTNKPGTVNQQPLYGCTSCYEECTYPADHLHVYNGECWCESCWCEIADWRDWIKLEPFRPAMKADYERLQAETERLQAECEKLRGLLAEIGRGCSRRDMPSEQTIASWAEAIDAAMQETNP